MTTTTTQTTGPVLTAIGSTPRHQMFTAIHKGLRCAMAETLLTVGRADGSDAQSCATAAGAVRALVGLCRMHLHSENQFIHPAMEARRPGSSQSTADEHVGHEVAFEALEGDALAVERSAGQDPSTPLAVLYQRLALFVADNYEHMFEEETHNQSVLWDAYSDDELRALEGAIVAAHTPEESMACIRWMVPALSPSERVGLLAGAREGMPAEAFDGLLGFAASLLDARDGVQLRAAFCSGPREREGWPR